MGFRRVGLEARLASGHSPIGAWFSQIGKLHQVHHMWHYDSLEQRRLTRQKAWEIDTWSGTVSKVRPRLVSRAKGERVAEVSFVAQTVKLTKSMDTKYAFLSRSEDGPGLNVLSQHPPRSSLQPDPVTGRSSHSANHVLFRGQRQKLYVKCSKRAGCQTWIRIGSAYTRRGLPSTALLTSSCEHGRLGR